MSTFTTQNPYLYAIFQFKGMLRVEVFFDSSFLFFKGKSGCGKTSTAKALCSLLQEPPHFIHTAMIRCRPLKGLF